MKCLEILKIEQIYKKLYHHKIWIIETIFLLITDYVSSNVKITLSK